MDGFSKFHFKDIHEGETIIKVVHRNWFYVFQQFVPIVGALLLYLIGLAYIPVIFATSMNGPLREVIYFFENFFLLGMWIFGFMIWIDYYFDIWVITSERIINIEQQGMFSRKSSELRFSKIQDVTTEVAGFLGTVINYGDVKVQTAGEISEFTFRTVSDPYKIKDIIMDLQKNAEHSRQEEFGELIKEKIDQE
jgi:uncharacterized membrane protein YdbT with pleckstrin-like domain